MTFYAVADFETLQPPIDDDEVEYDELVNDEVSFTKRVAKHVPCSAAYLIASTDPDFYMPPRIFKGIR